MRIKPGSQNNIRRPKGHNPTVTTRPETALESACDGILLGSGAMAWTASAVSFGLTGAIRASELVPVTGWGALNGAAVVAGGLAGMACAFAAGKIAQSVGQPREGESSGRTSDLLKLGLGIAGTVALAHAVGDHQVPTAIGINGFLIGGGGAFGAYAGMAHHQQDS